jgi:hypothetical protein
MKYTKLVFAALVLIVTAGAFVALAQQKPQPMTFFVTSAGKGDGANYGGLAGADAHCMALAKAAGRGDVKWVAYLSTQGAGAVNARDRIGAGPWVNARGQQVAANAAELHGDTIEAARLGNRIHKTSALTEKGMPANGVGDMPNQHDILTGTQTDGRAFPAGMDMTCSNWTSSETGMGSAMLGHHDRIGNNSGSWVAAHASRGCSQPNVMAGGGAGLLYCFSPDPPPAQPARGAAAPPAAGRGN